MSTIAERVAAGAAWLDENEPGWERRIDLATLNLADACRCVLGQVFDATSGADFGFLAGLRRIYPPADERGNGGDYGFAMTEIETVLRFKEAVGFWRALDEAWIALLKERHDAGVFSDS